MSQVKDSGTPGNNHATMPVGAVLDGAGRTLTMDPGTNLPTGVVLRDREWIIVETRNIDGVSNVTGECRYSETSADLADVAAFARNFQLGMGMHYTNFDLTVTHHKGGHIIDIYRGDAYTTISLATEDTNVAFTFPPFWVIDDITPLAPSVLVQNANIVVDSAFDDPSKHTVSNAAIVVSGGKVVFGIDGRAYPDLTEALVEGAQYELGIDCDAMTIGYYRFAIGDTEYSSLQSGVKTYTSTRTCPAGATTISIQGVNGFDGTMDNFTCKRV